jgi:hypothetical protein
MAANRLLALLALILATGASASDSRPSAPDPDLLEFLGTFETAGGKTLDPLFLQGGAAAGATSDKKSARRPAVRNKTGKETPPKGRETNDD